MARVHRPPPPVPVEQEEESYGVWADNEFDDDPTEIYENTDNPAEAEDENNSDYEEPDDPVPANPAVRPLPSPAAPALPPIPARAGFRPLPSPAFLIPEPRVSAVSPRTSPVPPAPVDDDEMYEAVDMPQSPTIDDDGEVYEVVDDSPVKSKPTNFSAFQSPRPVPKPSDGGFRAHPPIPKPDFQQKETPSRKSKPEIKSSASPNLSRRDMPLPPPVKAAPSGRAAPPIQRPVPSPVPSPPPSPDMEEMYTGAEDFYADADEDFPPPPPSFGSGVGKNTKPLPKPPTGCGDDEEDGDQYYEAVPETKPNRQKANADAKANRPIPALPHALPISKQETTTPSSGTLSRFPVEKLQAELARFASKNANVPEPVDDVRGSNFLLNVGNQSKSVGRVESMNTPEKPKLLPSVKRAESESTKRLETPVKNVDRKVSRITDVMNKFESVEKQPPENQGINLSPMFPKKVPYSADTSGNRSSPLAARSKPTNPVPFEVPNKKPAVPKAETSEALGPPRIPLPRASPVREIKSAAESTPNDTRALPKPPTDDELGGLYSYAWYFSDIERNDAEKKILAMQQDGAFLVRKSKRGGDSNPYTLTLLYKGFIYNLHIRRRPDKKYALGSEKPDEHVFNSVEDLISFHRNNPIEVIGDARKNAAPGKVVLKASPKK